MANCIVTGGAGFIGGHIARRLIADGHTVCVIDNLSHSVYSNVPKGCHFVEADIRHLPPLPNYQGVTAVLFHCAAISRTPPAVKYPVHCIDVNVCGTTQVLDFSRILAIPRVVFSSSNVVYAGETAYKVSKLAGEMMCTVYNDLYEQSVIALRYSNVYGPYIRKGDCAVFSSLRDSCLEHNKITITGDGNQSRDFTHVDDIVEANLLAWKSSYCGVVDICTGVNTTLNEVANYFECPVEYVGERAGDVKHIRQNPDPAMAILGWEAKIKLQDGIKDIWTF